MTRTYIKDEELTMPESGATLRDLALGILLLPDDEIVAIGGFFKALYLTSGLRRELRDYVIELQAESYGTKGLKLGAKTLARAYVEALRELNLLREVLGKPPFVPSVRKNEVSELKADEMLKALAKANDFYWNHDGES